MPLFGKGGGGGMRGGGGGGFNLGGVGKKLGIAHSAFAQLAPGQYQKTATMANSLMSKYGKPIHQMIGKGHSFLNNADDAVGSFTNVFQNQANAGMGYARDQNGQITSQHEANLAGQNVVPSRYGGNTVYDSSQQPPQSSAQPVQDDYGDEDGGGDMQQAAPQYRGSAAKQSKRIAKGKQLKQKGSGMQKFGAAMKGITSIGGEIAKMF